ncbi:hypothetical protein F2P56_008287 [Juglans regia]|uniref:Lectin-domain containing receptor kinase VI.3-like n=2 Tax=Juglans regia TaxID=51240 RepID=A0A2I4F3D7_JUGRE|nr:lectin-domain containing receptor kinase VI.3-like [Juglans regia]KAF5471499.1 hypothetical protein F2P56_008287 [Juglans regia]
MTLSLCFFAFLCLILFPDHVAQSQNVEFVFHGFKGQEASLITEGASFTKPTGLLRLTNRSNFVTGHAFYTKPVPIINRSSSSSSRNAYSFSTSFVFCIIPPGSGRGGHGFAFILSPDKHLPGAQDEHYLGIFKESNDGNSSNHIFAVEFDTVKGYNEPSDSEGNHVGININGMSNPVAARPAAYSEQGNEQNERDIKLESGDRILAWIEYDGQQKVVNVTISPAKKPKPSKPLITLQKDLTSILLDSMYVGFSASTGEKSSSHYILGWSFSTKGVAPPLNLSQLPAPPPEEKSLSFKPQVTAVTATLSVLTIILLGP